jgi:hypothetical protein
LSNWSTAWVSAKPAWYRPMLAPSAQEEHRAATPLELLFERRRAIQPVLTKMNQARRKVVTLRRLVGVAGLTVALLDGATAPALADDVAPGAGNAFGQHVTGMAPEHAVAHGADFGACVSAMARGLACPHSHP